MSDAAVGQVGQLDNNGERSLSWRRAVVVIAVTAACFALTLRVFWPGVMTYDSTYVYSYIAAGQAGDWQSPLETALWAAIDPIAPGAGSMFLFIATLYWLAFMALALVLARRVAWLGPATVLLGLAPPAFVFAGIIWRDIILASAWLLAAVLAWSVAKRRGALRFAVQALALALIVFAFLLRPNGLFAAPILIAGVLWPQRFDLKRAAVLYVPAVAALALLMPLVYYTMLGAKHEHSYHAIAVFDLGGISHFTGQNQFPVTFTPEQDAMVTGSCYRPTEWDIYWTHPTCGFVMAKIDAEKLFGSSTLTKAWLAAIATHPLAYLGHRAAVMAHFLFDHNLTMWTIEIAHPDRTVFPDNTWFQALKTLHDRLAPTPLFRAGTWLLLCLLWCIPGWHRRATPAGVFLIGSAGAAVIYMATFFPVGVAGDFRYAMPAVLAGLAGLAVMAAGPDTAPDPGTR